MTETEALKLLRRFNRWRRWENPDPFAEPRIKGPEMPDPKKIGEAIDVACRALVEHEAAMKVLRQIATGDNRTRRKKLASSCMRFLDAMRAG